MCLTAYHTLSIAGCPVEIFTPDLYFAVFALCPFKHPEIQI